METKEEVCHGMMERAPQVWGPGQAGGSAPVSVAQARSSDASDDPAAACWSAAREEPCRVVQGSCDVVAFGKWSTRCTRTLVMPAVRNRSIQDTRPGSAPSGDCTKRKETQMPGRDRTGPAGVGPLTGGGFGDCAGDLIRGPVAPRRFIRSWNGRSWGGRGGRGRRHVYRATGLTGWQRAGYTAPASDEATILRDEASRLRSMLEDVETRLQDLQEGQDE